MAIALQRIPDANVSWTEGGMLKHKHSDIGVAVAMPGGLITPIIRKAETKSLSTISSEMKDFAARARARKLKPEEYQGGTTAVSNLGMYGIKDFTAVINPPHADDPGGRRQRGFTMIAMPSIPAAVPTNTSSVSKVSLKWRPMVMAHAKCSNLLSSGR